MRTIVALYDDFNVAQDVVEDLVEAGFQRDKISIMANDARGQYASYLNRDVAAEGDVSGSQGASFGAVVGGLVGLGAMLIPGIGPVIAAGPLVAALVGAGVGATAGAVTGGITASLIDLGVDDEYAGYYAEGVRRGGTLVVAHAEDEWENQVREIMTRHDPVDISSRAFQWRATGWAGFDEARGPYMSDQTTARELDAGEEVRLPVTEEEVKVGKREVEKGGVRVETHTTETPVEEKVHLREEHVNVERHPVDRPASEADFITGDQSIEVTEMAEEPVVSKEARVVEEVVVKKDVEERDETVRDTVRRQDVEVEHMDRGTARGSGTFQPFESYAENYRTHFNNMYASSGHPYDYYVPAYRYGYMLATDPRYHDYRWEQLEPEIRRNWEDYNKGTWDDVKDAIRHAWNQIRDALD
jgi:stress response protein YsnF